jgi:single-strand DNA-binding protein
MKKEGKPVSQSVNKVILIGFLGDALEVRFSQQGKPVTRFTVAVNEAWKDGQGTRQERVEWFRIVCFGRLAEVCGQFLGKGRHVYIEGRLQTRKWEDRGGAKRTTVEVVASQMRILDRLPKDGNGAKASESSKAAEPLDENENPFNEPENDGSNESVPF